MDDPLTEIQTPLSHLHTVRMWSNGFAETVNLSIVSIVLKLISQIQLLGLFTQDAFAKLMSDLKTVS